MQNNFKSGIGLDGWLKKWKSNRTAKSFQSWIGWDKVGWMIEKSECITEVQFFSKWDWVGWLIEKVRVKQNWKSEIYDSGRIDSKTGGMHYVSYTPTSKSCKVSNTTKWKKIYNLKNGICLHMFKHCEFENHMKIYANANCK